MEKPPTFRIPLRTLRGRMKPKKEDLCSMLFGKLKIALVRLIDINGGFIAICQSNKDIEKITSSPVAAELERLGLEAKIPPQINAKRSVICRRIDPWIGQHTKEEIKEELESKQDWLKNNVREVVKFGEHSHIFKLVLASTEIAERVRERGILLFNMAVSPDQIETEVFVDITTCFTCYVLEEHLQKDCPRKDRKICSECAAEGHIWRECQSDIKKCINCGGAHRTMSMACPAKKIIIKKKKEEMDRKKEEKENQTYANVARAVVKENIQERPILTLPRNPSTKLLTCILYAHMANIGTPGTFAQELNNMLRNNGMQQEDMVFPANPPSQQVLGVQFTEEAPAAQALETKAKEPTKEKKRQRSSISPKATERRLKRLQAGEINYESTEDDTEEEPPQTPQMPPQAPQKPPQVPQKVQRMVSDLEQKEPRPSASNETKFDAKELNLKIYTHSSNPFPKNVTRQCIADGVRTGFYKYEYEANNSEEEVKHAILTCAIRLSNNYCINVGPPERLGKIKSGRRQTISQRTKSDKKNGQ